MVSPYFFDENGNTVKNLTQWDSNQKLILESTDDITIAPKIHFCNQNSEKALVVQSSLSNNQVIADIPNTLLEEPFNIIAYVYLVKEDSAKTIEKINIPVRKRPKPNDYEHKENIHVIYLTDLIHTVETLNENVTDAEAIRVDNENTRKTNELIRQQNFEQAIKDTNQAASDATAIANQILSDKEAGLFNGDVQYATFEVVDGELIMYNNPEMTHTNFWLIDGNLIVEVNG